LRVLPASAEKKAAGRPPRQLWRPGRFGLSAGDSGGWLASGRGCVLTDIGDAATAFGEDQARFIVTSAHADLMQAAGIPIRRIGTVSGHAVTGRGFSVAIADLRAAHDSFFKDWMEG
jgi:hypothetical protein